MTFWPEASIKNCGSREGREKGRETYAGFYGS